MRVNSDEYSCWTLNEDTPVWSARATVSLRKLLRERSSGYVFTFWDEFDEMNEYRDMKLWPGHNERHYVIGRSLDDVVGYAKVALIGATGNPMPVTTLGCHLKPLEGFDNLAQSLAISPAYEEYRGKGPVGTVDMIELFLTNHGFGSRLLQHIMRDEYELVEALVSTERNARFFELHGFRRSYKNVHDEVLVAWHNPAYR